MIIINIISLSYRERLIIKPDFKKNQTVSLREAKYMYRKERLMEKRNLLCKSSLFQKKTKTKNERERERERDSKL